MGNIASFILLIIYICMWFGMLVCAAAREREREILSISVMQIHAVYCRPAVVAEDTTKYVTEKG